MAQKHCLAMSSAGLLLAGLTLALALVPYRVAAGPPLTAEQQSTLVESGVVGDEVIAALSVSAGKRVRVMVAYSLRETSSRLGGGDHAMTRSAAITATRNSMLSRLSPQGFTSIHEFRSVPGFAGSIDSTSLMSLAADPLVRRIDMDAGGRGALGEALPVVGLDQVKAMGFTGDGVTVALLDTGADLDHPDLVDSIVAERCFCTGCCPGGLDMAQGAGSAEDDHGHGTNIAGIITSDGIVAPQGGAPDANIVLVKVLDENNTFCCSSDVVAGLDWIIDERPDVDIVNLSLGTTRLFPGECDDETSFTMSYAAAIDSLRSLGVLVLVATRNDGSESEISAPACIANAFAVAASDDNDLIYSLSNSNGQTDLFAPGVDIQSTGTGNGALKLTGTSQATALTSACVTAFLDAYPNADPAGIEQALVHSPTTLDRGVLSFPRLDCADALDVPEPDSTGLLAAALATLGLFARRNYRRAERPPQPLRRSIRSR